LTAEPSLLDQALAEHPDIVTRAVETGRLEAVQLLVNLGVDVTDPMRAQRITALHAAASEGRRDMVELLLRAGADPNARDCEFDATPSAWAHHQGHTDIAQYLASIEL
jgi:ankyrin repeat protein